MHEEFNSCAYKHMNAWKVQFLGAGDRSISAGGWLKFESSSGRAASALNQRKIL